MGAWGANLYQDDVALDVKDEYKDNLRRGKTNEEAMQEIIDKYQELLEDEEDRGVFWLALALSLIHIYNIYIMHFAFFSLSIYEY